MYKVVLISLLVLALLPKQNDAWWGGRRTVRTGVRRVISNNNHNQNHQQVHCGDAMAQHSKGEHRLANYVGELKDGRMHGYGTYHFSSGTRFEGEFRDGKFHGKGILYFVNGGRYQGDWENGIQVKGQYVYSDGLLCEPGEWSYCTKEVDRRFYKEHLNGMNPVNRCLLTAGSDAKTGQPTQYIPSSCYDTGDGVYDPSRKAIYLYGIDEDEPLGDYLRYVTEEEHDWIVENCRKGWDENVGYQM